MMTEKSDNVHREPAEIPDTGEEVVLLTDLSDGTVPPIPVGLSQAVFHRLVNVLQANDLIPEEVVRGVYTIGALFGGGKATKFPRVQHGPPPLSVEQERTFSVIAASYYEEIHNYLAKGLQGRQRDAEDLTQQVFEKAYRNFGRFIPRENVPSPVRAWLFAIARNLRKNFYRDETIFLTNEKSPQESMGQDNRDVIEFIPDPKYKRIHSLEQEKHFADSIETLHELVRNMTKDDWKLTLYLKIALGLTNAETGRVLGRSEGAIKSLYSRMLSHFRDLLPGDVDRDDVT